MHLFCECGSESIFAPKRKDFAYAEKNETRAGTWCCCGYRLIIHGNFDPGFIDTEKARELLMASIVATIVIPTLIYVYLWLFQLFTKKKDDEK